MIAREKNAREEKRECEMFFTLNDLKVSASSFVELFLEPSRVCVNSKHLKCF